MLGQRWRRRAKFWTLVVLLGVLGGVVSFWLLRFLDAFYSYAPNQYEPKGMSRERVLEKDTSGQTGK